MAPRDAARVRQTNGRLWQLETREPRGYVPTIQWTPDGEHLAVGESSGIVRIYESRNWRLARVIYCPERSLSSLAWSPDGRWLATVGGAGALRVWTARGAPVSVSFSAGGMIGPLAWSDDSQMIAVVEQYRQVVVRDRMGVRQ